MCGSHLLRDVEAMRGHGGTSEAIGDALLAQAHQSSLQGSKGDVDLVASSARGDTQALDVSLYMRSVRARSSGC